MKIRTLIIDDESLARDLLRTFLQAHPQIEIIGECEHGFDGLDKIDTMKPDLVLLDIQMPKLTGLEMIELLSYQPHIIFTTAYDQYALKAFELSAVDYLLKPFAKDRLFDAIEKVKQRMFNQEKINLNEELSPLLSVPVKQRIVVKDKQRVVVVPVEDIFHFEALDDYVLLHTKQARYIKQCTMKSLEESLDKQQFVRVHRSHLVQVAYIAHLEQAATDSYAVLLKNGKQVRVSKSGYKRLKEILDF